MLATLALAAHLILPPDPDWSTKKRLLRHRVAEVVETGNARFNRNDGLPKLVKQRLPGLHGKYDLGRDRMVLDLESLHDRDKFWHVYRETIPHEWAHKLNAELHGARGHGRNFRQVTAALQEALRRQR